MDTISVITELKVQEILFSSAVCSHDICVSQQQELKNIFFPSVTEGENENVSVCKRKKPHFGYSPRCRIQRFQFPFPWEFKYLLLCSHILWYFVSANVLQEP